MIEPAGSSWASLARGFTRPASSNAFRAELGLPADGLVVMSGHQVEFWHAGIFAKRAACAAAAAKLGGSAGWLAVDQDSSEPAVIRYPARRDGRLVAAAWEIGPQLGNRADVPPACRPTADPRRLRDLPTDAATPGVSDGLARVAGALASASGESTLASQVIAATDSLLAGVVRPMPTVLATSISRTGLFGEVLTTMRADPGRCVDLYNRAVEAFPGSRLRPLDATRGELPLWHLREGLPRRRVLASMLGSIPASELAPRALLMTGMIRHAGCDLFIHGTGGAAYDPAGERWLAAWLGWSLAPAVVASATLSIPIEGVRVVSASEAGRARWAAHHARHDPGLLGDEWAARRKAALLGEIREATTRGLDPREHYDEMHRLLSRVRLEHAQRLRELEERAARASADAAQSIVASDRTWPFPLHDPRALGSLADSVSASLASGGW